MTLAITLFGLRLLAAITLLAFVGAIAWIAYQDLKNSAESRNTPSRFLGHLRVIASGASGPGIGTLFPLLVVTSVGRSKTNTVVLLDETVSNEHALITRRANNWQLEDLGSRNGAYLNDLPVTAPVVLGEGDVITIGNTELKLELEQYA